MKQIKRILIFIAFVAFVATVKAQAGAHWNYIYTLKIQNVTNKAQAKLATDVLRKISGTLRCDFNDSTDYFIIKSNENVSESDFITGLQQAGYDVSNGIHFTKKDNDSAPNSNNDEKDNTN